ncbi:MAG: glycine cleavage system aminomethyltransferase GcvT [Planctomycetia bacterium]|nr:glycine cleavage system aminomethyltransferase GcvT [Planctomycetia bacterium]
MSQPLLETPLCRWHESHGGRMVDFAGWKMPVQYGSIVEEHLATRRAAGLFDVSHMGRLTVAGPAAIDWLEGLLTRRVAGIEPGQARYTLVTGQAPGGGDVVILDDAIVARDEDAADGSPRLSLVVNASNRERVVGWLSSRLPAAGVRFADRTFQTAMIAVQGPRAVDVVTGLANAADAERIGGLRPYRTAVASIAGHRAGVSRSGYTGEDGVELVVDAAAAEPVWNALHAAGRPVGLAACGLGARDTLRLEAGMPLYGHELREESDPFAIGLGLGVTLDGRTFPGAERFADLRAHPRGRVRVGLAFDSKRTAREGSSVRQGGREVGTVTSGSFAPSLDRAVAMALVDRDASAPGTQLDVVVREVPQAAHVTPLPFHRRA